MGRFRTAAGDLGLYAFGATIALGIWALVQGAAGKVPAAYDAASPVVAFGYGGHPPVADIFRDRDKICWTLYIHKLAPAEVKRYVFTVAGGTTSGDIDTAAYLADEHNNPLKGLDAEQGKLVSHPVGARWKRRYCFDVAGRVPDFRQATISGTAYHDRFPHLWTTETPVPSFVVPPWRQL